MDIVDEEMYPDDDAIAQLPNSQLFALMDVDSEDAPVNTVPTVELPPRFIFVKHHPHANKPNEIIPLDTSPSATGDAGLASSPAATPAPTDRPWAPFRTYADFKFTSRRIKRRSPNVEIDEDLLDLRDGSLARDSLVTFRNHRDMEKVLAAARVSNVAVSHSVYHTPMQLITSSLSVRLSPSSLKEPVLVARTTWTSSSVTHGVS
jgi:hypothetical protein